MLGFWIIFRMWPCTVKPAGGMHEIEKLNSRSEWNLRWNVYNLRFWIYADFGTREKDEAIECYRQGNGNSRFLN